MSYKCEQCGVCCKLFLINLNEDEYYSGKFQTVNADFGPLVNFTEAESLGLNFLEQKEDGSCFYLKQNGCSIHEMRPQVCRNFFCRTTNPKYAQMVKEIAEFKSKNNLSIEPNSL